MNNSDESGITLTKYLAYDFDSIILTKVDEPEPGREPERQSYLLLTRSSGSYSAKDLAEHPTHGLGQQELMDDSGIILTKYLSYDFDSIVNMGLNFV